MRQRHCYQVDGVYCTNLHRPRVTPKGNDKAMLSERPLPNLLLEHNQIGIKITGNKYPQSAYWLDNFQKHVISCLNITCLE